MATTGQRITALEQRVTALETWRTQQLVHNRKQEETDVALAARIAALEGGAPPEPGPEPEPPPAAPIASFTATPQSGTAPLTVVLKDTSSGNPTSWAWDIGAGMFKYTTKDATVVIPAADVWTVKLTATNAGGSSTATKSVTVTGGVVIEPTPEPPPGGPGTPPNGTVVPAGTGLKAAVANAPNGAVLILRGGDHNLGSWGSGTTPGIMVRNKKLSLWAYQGERPRIHAGGSRPNLLYAEGGGVVDVHGIELATITGASYDDSNGSALAEPRAGGILDFYDCWFTFAPGSITERQHQFYIADSPGRARAERCHFDGGKNDGTGFHCYHAPGGPCFVTDCDFKNYGSGSSNGIAIIVDQSGADVAITNCTFRDCMYAAIQHRASARCVVKDCKGTNCARNIQKTSTTNLTDINNVWT